MSHRRAMDSLAKILLVTCVLLLRIIQCSTNPTSNPKDLLKLEEFLTQFGYLITTDTEIGNLRTEESLQHAISEMQAFANITVTGDLDEATEKLMRAPRCGVPDNKNPSGFSTSNALGRRHRRYSIQGQKWQTTTVTWGLVNHTMSNAGQIRRIIKEALDVWSRAIHLTFQEVHGDFADIKVMFVKGKHGDGRDFDGPGNVLAHAFFPGDGRGGDAHFDDDENWSTKEGEGTSLMAVAVHEFGHSLGLAHSSVVDSIMYPYYFGYTPEMYKELREDDRLAIQQIYGARQKHWGDLNTTRRPPTTTRATTLRSYYPERPVERDWQREQIERDRRRLEHERKERERKKQKHYPTQTHAPIRTTKATTTTTTTTTTMRTTRHHQTKKEAPEKCNTSYDAITMIRGELFIFKDRYYWRIGDKGLYTGYPSEINRLWEKMPNDLSHIDAVYENKNQKIVFFIGKMYYVYNANRLEEGYPKALTTLGLPATLQKIDAVLVWGHNNRTYFYSGMYYWKFDEDLQHVELDYPRDMTIWRGIGYHIDSAFQYKDGKTYFFKGKSFWQFNDSIMKVKSPPESSATRWMRCPHMRPTYSNEVYNEDKRHHLQPPRREPFRKEPLTAFAPQPNINLAALLICSFVVSWLSFKSI